MSWSPGFSRCIPPKGGTPTVSITFRRGARRALRVGGRADLAAQILERSFQLAVAEVLGDFRAALVWAFYDLLISLKFRQVVLFLAVHFDQETFVGRDAPFVLVLAAGAGAVEVAAAGPPERRRGQLEPAARLERVDRLHAAFAVAARADDDGPAMVLQACTDDLAGTGAAAVDQAHHREGGVAAVAFADVARLRAIAGP